MNNRTLDPHFYFKIRSVDTRMNPAGGGMYSYRVVHAADLIEPKSADLYSDPQWVKYAVSKGFIDRETWIAREKAAEERRLKAEKKAREDAKRAEERWQRELAEQRKREAEAYQRNYNVEMKRRQAESPILLKKKGIMVCKKVNGWNSNDYPYLLGYVENSSENRIQVRVNSLMVRPGWEDSNFKPKIIWDDVNNWFICSQY